MHDGFRQLQFTSIMKCFNTQKRWEKSQKRVLIRMHVEPEIPEKMYLVLAWT